MKKNGFTISEALVVLAAIGVLAMLTMPSYVSGQRKLTYSKVLQVAVANFNTAMTNMIAREGVENLRETAAWQALEDNNGDGTLRRQTPEAIVNSFARNLGRYIAISHYDKGITNYSLLREVQANGLPAVLVPGNFVRFFTKNGVEYKIEISDDNPPALSEERAIALNTNYTDRAAIVRIDINGESAPNIAGRDLHFYELGINGILYPFGSRDQVIYNNQNQNPEDLEFPNLDIECRVNLDGQFCAAYLAINNYNMDY